MRDNSKYPQCSNAVRDVRRAAGLSQAELASKVGVNRSTISNTERGSSSPSMKLLNKIGVATNRKPVITFEKI